MVSTVSVCEKMEDNMFVAKRLKSCQNADVFTLPLMEPMNVYIKQEAVETETSTDENNHNFLAFIGKKYFMKIRNNYLLCPGKTELEFT